MNGQKYDWKMYEWEPVVDDSSADAYFQTEPAPADIAAAVAPLAAPIIVAPQESVLSRPVGELLASARESLQDSVLSKPVGELLTSAAGDSVLARPVGELLGSAREAVSDSLHKPVSEVLRGTFSRRDLAT